MYAENNQKGFSFVSALVALSLASVGAYIFMGVAQDARVLSNQYKEMELRADLLYALKKIHDRVDCDIYAEPYVNKVRPNAGQPIQLSDVNGNVIVPQNGGRIGRFVFIANYHNDDRVKLRAAALKKNSSDFRNAINSKDKDDYVKIQNIKKQWDVWDTNHTQKKIDKYFESLGESCVGAIGNAEKDKEKTWQKTYQPCQQGEYMVSIDHERGKFICQKFAKTPCGPNQYATIANNFKFTCKNLPTGSSTSPVDNSINDNNPPSKKCKKICGVKKRYLSWNNKKPKCSKKYPILNYHYPEKCIRQGSHPNMGLICTEWSDCISCCNN